MTVQRQTRLQAQSVAGSQPDGRSAQGEHAIPESPGLVLGDKELEAKGLSCP